MEIKAIDGELFERLAASGAACLKANKKTVNDLNVFPIPDGDTGDNMYLTLNGGISFLKNEKGATLAEKSESLARGMLLNARGNSGVILSQFFAGIAKGLEGVDAASIETFAKALRSGVEQAYSSVVQPVEGTVLTVAREATDYAYSNLTEDEDADKFFQDYVEEMKRSLDRTPTLLDVLGEAGVVDSGGAGLLVIFEGMLAAIEGKTIDMPTGEADSEGGSSIDFSKFNEDSEMLFGYCTEFLLQLQNSKVDATNFDINIIINYLNEMGGESIVAFKTGTVVKVHVHTMTPYKALEFCQKFGEFLTVKIENMTLQHNETSEDFATKKFKKTRPHKTYALVTVAIGEGLIETFSELGADVIIEGGQGKNPSIERFIEAFDEANADHVFVLPNNSNIIMAANQAAELYKKSNIHVINTKNFGHAYSILSMLDYSSEDADAIAESMTLAMQDSVTGMVTNAIRSVTLDGVEVAEGDYIGFTDKTMLVSGKDRLGVFKGLSEKLGADEKEFMIVFYGKDVTDGEKTAIKESVEELYPNMEFYPLDGGQDVYDFIMILE